MAKGEVDAHSEKQLIIRLLVHDDCANISQSFQALGWNKPAEQYEQYLQEQVNDERLVLIALWESSVAGYITIVWRSAYIHFSELGIPEIKDFNVLPIYRNQGIGTALINQAETRVKQRASKVGIGVGLHQGYGAAQRLYVKRGYVPDGRGVTYNNGSVLEGESITCDDNLILHLAKDL